MDIKLSARVGRIQPSPTLAVAAKANKLRSEGIDVVSLAAGEPDFDTPEHIKQAAIDAMSRGATRYTAVAGTDSLRQAIVEKLSRDNQLEYTPEQILVSNGGKQSFYNLCQAFIESGDEVIIPAPYWVSYPDMVLLANGTPVFITGDQAHGFKITAEQLEKAITDRTKLLVLNSPSNPSGSLYSHEELKALGAVLKQHSNILIATDDMYEHILFAKQSFSNIANACPELKFRTMVLNGVSKAYAMTGWRIGYAAGPQDLINAMKKIQSQSTSNPCSISQAAAQAALSSDQQCVEDMRTAFEERHDYVVERLNTIPGVSCLPSQGTFYCFPNIKGAIDLIDGIDSDIAFATYLLEHANVAIVPGSAFGLPGYARLSFATSQAQLELALDRLEGLMKNI